MRSGRWEDLSSNPSVQFGSLMEEWVAGKGSEMVNSNFFKCPYYLGWRKSPWITCSKDFHVDSPDERWGVEVKTTSSYGIKKQLGENLSSDTALSYRIQMQHQMLVDELDGCYNPVLVLKDIGDRITTLKRAVQWIREDGVPIDEIMRDIPHEVKIFEVRRDEDAIREIRNYLTRMRELFVSGGYPPVDGSEKTSQYFRSIDRIETAVTADDKQYGNILKIKKLKGDVAGTQDEIRMLENKLLDGLGEAREYMYNGNKVMEVKRIESNRFDTKTFKAENPELADKYNKVSVSTRISYNGEQE